jgi:putative hydrolase of the HAD superfamily
VRIQHLLLDADGVLQHVGGSGWRTEVSRRLGDHADEFVRAVDALEAPALRGETDFPDGLDEVLAGFGLDLDAEQLYAGLWESITVAPGTVALAREAREAGVGVHLATNQHRRRATLMQRTLGYEDVTDGGFYSCEVGAAKPEPTFFARVLERLGGPDPAAVLFVDDSAPNVETASSLGLATVHWHLDEGHDALRSRLAAAGLPLHG